MTYIPVVVVTGDARKEIDIEFPLYRKLQRINAVFHRKIISPTKSLTIITEPNTNGYGYTVWLDPPSWVDVEDYLLGKNEYELPSSSFNSLMKDVIQFIDKYKTFSIIETHTLILKENIRATNTTEVEVTFPLYRQMVTPIGHSYYKVLNRNKSFRISRKDNWPDYSVAIQNETWVATEDFLLGKGNYACSPEEFVSVAREIKSVIHSYE